MILSLQCVRFYDLAENKTIFHWFIVQEQNIISVTRTVLPVLFQRNLSLVIWLAGRFLSIIF